MKIRDRLLNILADKLKEYQTPIYDKILVCDVRGETRKVFSNYDGSVMKEIPNTHKTGMINITELLSTELSDNVDKRIYKDITFCDKSNVVLIHNSKNDRYYEDVHESFEWCEEKTYLKLDNKDIYETVKNYILQTSMYHNIVRFQDEIPNIKVYDKLFQQNNKLDKENEKENNKMIDNCIQLDGIITRISKTFTKNNGEKANFIDLKQKYENNGSIKYNKISVMIPSKYLEKNNFKENDKVSIIGKLNNYVDRNNNQKSVINCYEIRNISNEKTLENKER